jgi:ribosomal-protein-alanine N-acetyltransferase
MSARPKPPAPVIRALRAEDVDELVRIEHLAYPYPWTRGIFADCIRVGYACHGLQLGRALAGYVFLNWVAGESHLLNLCVDPAWQRRGYGALLLGHAMDEARAHGCAVMLLEVRPTNTEAIRLYLRNDFEVIGRRPAYYETNGGREDAIVMRRDLAGF